MKNKKASPKNLHNHSLYTHVCSEGPQYKILLIYFGFTAY